MGAPALRVLPHVSSELRKTPWASFCYGLSALLPSRVELHQQEIASRQILCGDFLMRLHHQLQDYRRHFEPQVLSSAIYTWQGVLQRLLLLPQHQHFKQESAYMEARLSATWPAVPEGWKRQASEALRQLVCMEPAYADEEVQERQDLEQQTALERRTRREGNWVWTLPDVLRGPSLFHDLLRIFIYRSLFAGAGRLLGPHVSKLLQIASEDAARSQEEPHGDATAAADGSKPLGEGGSRTSSAHEEAKDDEVLCGLARGIEALCAHVQSELLLYADVFVSLLPLKGEHTLLVLAAAKSVLLSVVPLVQRCADRAAEDCERRGLPARGGRAVLAALGSFERLTDEVSSLLFLARPRPLRSQ